MPSRLVCQFGYHICYIPSMIFGRASRASKVGDLLSLTKPGIVASNTLTALGGLALSPWVSGLPLPGLGRQVLCLCVGTASLVAGSCTINNWFDRDIDALMARTEKRATASGRIGAGATLTWGAILIGLGIGSLSCDGPIPALLGILGALVYILPYTLWVKRRSGASSLVGGIAGALPPLIGWAVMDPSLGGPALLLFAFLVAWQQAHVRALAIRRQLDFDHAAIPMPGMDRGSSGAMTSGRTGRRALLAWILVLLPLPFLVAKALPQGQQLAFALPEAGLILLWWALGFTSSRPTVSMKAEAWGSLMFFLSLFDLVFFFAGLLLAKLAGLGP